MLDVTRTELAGVPCLVLRDDAATEPAPVLVHYHGWTGSKGERDRPDRTLARLASAGMLVVAPDCVEHGERQTDAWFRARFNGFPFVCDVMDRTRAEAPALLDAVLGLSGAATGQPQVTGTSMGGLIAQMVVAEEQRYAAMVSVVGRSSFYQADEWCRQAQAGNWCDRWCGEHAPQSHPERYRDRPVLFIDGGQDTDCPAATNAATVELINEAGGNAEQFVDGGAGHEFSPPMRDRYTEWVLEHAGRPGL